MAKEERKTAEERREAKPGDYITFRVKGGAPEDIRQAVLMPDGTAKGELGSYEVGEVLGVVPDGDLHGSTLAHVLVERWRLKARSVAPERREGASDAQERKEEANEGH